jgi:CBS domain-containing protein
MRAKDIMTTPVISAGPETPIREIAQLLVDNRISAVPIIDGTQRLVGIVSEGDLMRRPEAGTETRRSWWLYFFTSLETAAAQYARSHGLLARDVMTPKPVTATEDADASEIAEVLESFHIKRVPIVRDGRVIGIVSRANLVQALASAKAPASQRTDDDSVIRENTIAALSGQPWETALPKNVIVQHGVVHLWGIANSVEERSAAQVAVEHVPGVKRIENHLVLRPMVLMDD